MTGRMRVAVAVVTGLVGFAAAASAQITGMPLFTNPRYGTGLRVHADFGRPTNTTSSLADLTVIEAGVSLALGPLGINVAAGMPKTQLNSAQGCIQSPTLSCSSQKYSAAALAQLRLFGGGRNPLAVSIFGGAAMDISSYDVANYQASGTGSIPKELTIPVGVAVGFHTPLLGLNVWGAPRMNMRKWVNCSGTCQTSDNKFRWAVGADLPILSIISIRAAFDSGKIATPAGGTETVSVWGVGASIGIGGMR